MHLEEDSGANTHAHIQKWNGPEPLRCAHPFLPWRRKPCPQTSGHLKSLITYWKKCLSVLFLDRHILYLCKFRESTLLAPCSIAMVAWSCCKNKFAWCLCAHAWYNKEARESQTAERGVKCCDVFVAFLCDFLSVFDFFPRIFPLQPLDFPPQNFCAWVCNCKSLSTSYRRGQIARNPAARAMFG